MMRFFEEKLSTRLLLKNSRAIWEATRQIVRFFKRRKVAYQAFVEKRAGQLEKLPLLNPCFPGHRFSTSRLAWHL